MKLTQKVIFFSTTLNRVNSLGKFRFDGSNFFFSETSVMGQILQKMFPPQNESYTVKLSFSGVLKHFCGN